jgi:hypothetical protein
MFLWLVPSACRAAVFPVPPACVKLGGNGGEMYPGTDGRIWMNCGDEAERVALDGKATPVNPALKGLQLGTFAAGANGMMRATANQNDKGIAARGSLSGQAGEGSRPSGGAPGFPAPTRAGWNEPDRRWRRHSSQTTGRAASALPFE